MKQYKGLFIPPLVEKERVMCDDLNLCADCSPKEAEPKTCEACNGAGRHESEKECTACDGEGWVGFPIQLPCKECKDDR